MTGRRRRRWLIKGRQEKIGVTPPCAAPCDTHPSDATDVKRIMDVKRIIRKLKPNNLLVSNDVHASFAARFDGWSPRLTYLFVSAIIFGREKVRVVLWWLYCLDRAWHCVSAIAVGSVCGCDGRDAFGTLLSSPSLLLASYSLPSGLHHGMLTNYYHYDQWSKRRDN